MAVKNQQKNIFIVIRIPVKRMNLEEETKVKEPLRIEILQNRKKQLG